MIKTLYKRVLFLMFLFAFLFTAGKSWAIFDVCIPGSRECVDESSFQECNDSGEGFNAPVSCGSETESCFAGQCLELCEIASLSDSSMGCSFLSKRMDNFEFFFGAGQNTADTVVVGNFFSDKTANVQFYFTPVGTNVEQTLGAPVVLAPETSTQFDIEEDFIGDISVLRQGGTYRVESDIPVQAYLHSPIVSVASNDSSVLIPEATLKTDYVVAAYDSFSTEIEVDNEPTLFEGHSYLNVIGLEDDTNVQFSPFVNTAGGTGVDAVTAGNTGMVTMNRFDTLQVRAEGLADISGTLLQSDKPIWVIGGNICSNVPPDNSTCDHLQATSVPTELWSTTYVGTHSPVRGEEQHIWRVYAGADNVTITTEPPVPGTPVTLNKGEFQELTLDNGTDVVFNGDGPFLPVQYLMGIFAVGEPVPGISGGDPSMYQAIPVEQFLKRYTFETGVSDPDPDKAQYNNHFVQIIRPAGAADVFIDGVLVAGYKIVGSYEVANVQVDEGSHFAISEEAFGLNNLGYGGFVSYAYPGGFIKRKQNSSNLVVNKVASEEEVKLGQTFTYAITIENTGPQDEPNAILVDQLADELQIISVTPGDPTCQINGQVVLCKLGEIKNGESALVEITVELIGVPADNQIINTAIVHGDKNNPENNDDGLDGAPGAQGGRSEGISIVRVDPTNLQGSGNMCSLNSSSGFVGYGLSTLLTLVLVLYVVRLRRLQRAPEKD